MDPKQVIAQEAAANPKFRETVSDGLSLHGLLDHPGWIALKARFDQGKEGYGKNLTSRLLFGEEVSQREIDYHRGCKEMAEAIFAEPEKALASLERTTEQLLARTWQQEQAQDDLESAYIQEAATHE